MNSTMASGTSSRQIAKQFGISRAAQRRATKIAEIPEDEFEAMIEAANPPTVTALVNYARQPAPRASLRRETNKQHSDGSRGLTRTRAIFKKRCAIGLCRPAARHQTGAYPHRDAC